MPHHIDQAVAHLSALFRPGDHATIRPTETWIDGGKKVAKVDYKGAGSILIGSKNGDGNWHLDPDRLRQNITDVLKRAEAKHTNQFLGVCPRLGSGGRFEQAWQIRTVRALWADVDDCEPDEAVKRCLEAKLPEPSIIVASGHGAHFYWLLVEPYLIDDVGDPPPVETEWTERNGKRSKPRKYIKGDGGERLYLDIPINKPDVSAKAQHVQDILSGIAATIGGDHTQDLSRLLRLAGSANRKNQRNGQEPVPSQLLKCDSEERYAIELFEQFAGNSPARKQRENIALIPLPKKQRMTGKRQDRLHDLIAGSVAADVGQRSEADYALICFAIESGLPQAEVWSQISGVGKFAEGGERYFQRTWNKAVSHTRERIFAKAHHRLTGKSSNKQPNQPVGANGQQVDSLEREKKIADTLGILIMGEGVDHSIHVFARHLGKTDRIKSVANLKYSDLLQIGGPTIRECVVEKSDGDVPPDKIKISDVRNAFALLASKRRIAPDLACGQGVHVGDSGKILIVDSGGGAIWDHEQRKLLPVREPFADGKLLDFECTKAFDFVDLEKRLNGMTPERMAAAVNGLADILSAWKWKRPGNPILAAGLVVATMVQATWKWRPQVGITGESGSAKTTLLDTLAAIFGGLALRADKPTEAGLRQAVGNSSQAILIDEFEKSKDRHRILELLRTASRGSRILRGTVDQRGVSFGLRHMAWVASVELGLNRQPDKNRFLKMELVKPDRWMAIPDSQTLHELGCELFAVAISICTDAMEQAESLKQTQLPGIDSRTIESHTAPAAVLAVAGVFGTTSPAEILSNAIGCTGDHIHETESDQLALLRDILAVKIVVDRQMFTVGEILNDPYRVDGSREAMERDGLKRIGDRLFVAPRLFEARLRGSMWDGQSAGEILSRLPSAEAGRDVRIRCAGVRHYGVAIPWYIVEQFISAEDEGVTDGF